MSFNFDSYSSCETNILLSNEDYKFENLEAADMNSTMIAKLFEFHISEMPSNALKNLKIMLRWNT